MENDVILRKWLQHVSDNYDRLKHVSENLSQKEQLLYVRQALAEIGKEVTPNELHDFHLLLKETLSLIDQVDSE